jgi:hypothetical protein
MATRARLGLVVCGSSGAAALSRKTSDVRLVQWHGRWSRPQTLEANIQDAAAAQSLQPLPEDARQRVFELSASCLALLSRSVTLLAAAERKQWSRERIVAESTSTWPDDVQQSLRMSRRF